MATPGIMTIDRLEIYVLDSVIPLRMKFKKGVNVIEGEGSEQALEIIESLISGRAFTADYGFKVWCTVGGENLIVEAENDNPFSPLTPVEQRLCVFDSKSKYDWSREFYNYLNDEDVYSYNNTLAKQTCGISSTQSFRVYFNRYIDRLTATNTLKENGVFRRPSGVSQMQFNFDCYAKVLDFWDGFNGIRDMNHILLPICVFGDGLDCEILGKRQIFLAK